MKLVLRKRLLKVENVEKNSGQDVQLKVVKKLYLVGYICQGRNSRGRKYRVIDRNHTLFWINVQRQRRMYLVIIERRLQRRDKDIRAESDLLNDLGFNLYVALQSLVVRLVAYFRVKEVTKTEVLKSRVKESE